MNNIILTNMIFTILDGNYTSFLSSDGTNLPDIFGMALAPMIEVFLGEEVLYAWIVFMTFSMLYLKGQKIEIPAVVSLIFGVVALQYLPKTVHGIALILITLASASLIYRIFRSRD